MRKSFIYILFMSMLFTSCANETKHPPITLNDLEQATKTNLDNKDTTVLKIQELDISKLEKATSKESENKSPVNKKPIDINSKPIDEAKKNLSPNILFDQTTHDFGRIIQGDTILHEFKFKNTGKSPLIIEDAKASCGCTQPIYPFTPIPVGGKGSILVQFNSTGRLGRQMPSIEVISNAKTPKVNLNLVGEVITEVFKDPINKLN